MKRFLAVIALLICFSARAAIFNNSFTTNNPGQVPAPLFTTTSTLFPLMVLNTGFSNQFIQYSPSLFMTGTNGFLRGTLNAGSGNFTNFLRLNGADVLTNAPGSGITNSGTGTANTLAKWTDTNSLGNSHITDSSVAAMTAGITNTAGANLFASGEGSLAGGSSGFEIDATGNGSLAWGITDSGSTLAAQNPGSIAFGSATGTGSILSSGLGSFVGGSLDGNGLLQANGSGAFAFGSASGDGQIVATANGATAFGESTAAGGTINANGGGSFAIGNVAGVNGLILASGSGSFAGGSAEGTNQATAQGSFVWGFSDSGERIDATGTASFAFGQDVSSTAAHAWTFGRHYTNSSEGFSVGLDGVAVFQADSTGIATAGQLFISGQTGFPYTDDGTQLLRNGVPVGGGGGSTNLVDSGAAVLPVVDNVTDLGTNGFRFLNFWSYGLDIDGDIRVSGNISPRDVPYIWPVAQGAANTIMVNDGTGVLSWEPRTNSIAAAPANGISPVIALTMTGTNVDANQIDWNATNVCYRITLTGNAFFGSGVCINVPATNNFKWIQLNLVQDATGSHFVTFTNSIYAGPGGTFAYTTNASAWDSLVLINSPQTNGNIAVLPSNFLHR